MKLYRKTKNLIIRPLKISDHNTWREAFSSIHNSKNIWDIGGKKKKDLTLQKFKKLLASQNKLRKQDYFYDLAVFERATGHLVGIVNIMNVVRGLSQTAFLGYRVFNRHWGRGYGRESVKAALDIAFNDVKLHRMEAGVEPGNIRSIRLARSLKLRKEGLKKRAVFLRNKWVDLIIYSATCEEFGIKWKGQAKSREH